MLGLGTVSLLTDISSESVAAVLPLYITLVVGLGPLAFGFIDGVYQGISAVVRIAGGRWADRSDRPKWVAFTGYALSAVTRFGLLVVSGFWAITSVIAVDRLGKGLRTGPRDALIATASEPEHLGRNFGVHRAMDTAGALIGPLLAFAILAMFPIGLLGFQTIFVFSCAFAVMGVAVLAIAVPDLRRNPKNGARGSAAGIGPAPARPGWSDLASPGLRRLLLAAGALSLVTIGDGFIYLALQAGGHSRALFPVAVRRDQPGLPAARHPNGQARRPVRPRAGVRRRICAVAGVLPARLAHVGGPFGLVRPAAAGSVLRRNGRGAGRAGQRTGGRASRASGISAAQTVVALARFGASVGFGVLWQVAGLSTALLVTSLGLLMAIGVACILLRVRATGPGDERTAAGAESAG